MSRPVSTGLEVCRDAKGRYHFVEKPNDTEDGAAGCESDVDDAAAIPGGKNRWKNWKVILQGGGKLAAVILLLYCFICSLDILTSGFRLLGGHLTGSFFNDNPLLSNPVAGLMIGVLATVCVQSSSTSTSIVVAMVSSGIIEVPSAIPIVMGANIGTSFTNTLVSMAHSGDTLEFERAFAGATVHDMFNWLTVGVMLPLECAFHVLQHFTYLFVGDEKSMQNREAKRSLKIDFLKKLTKPLTKKFVQLDSRVIQGIALGDPSVKDKRILKTTCVQRLSFVAIDDDRTPFRSLRLEEVETNLTQKSSIEVFDLNSTATNINDSGYGANQSRQEELVSERPVLSQCDHFMALFPQLSDAAAGVVVLVFSLMILCSCLLLLVKVLQSVFKGSVSKGVARYINADFPEPFSFLTGYAAILVGAVMTVLVQSSSIFTSTLTPLIGVGAITVERAFPLTLGSNVGTTVTAILAALASSGAKTHSAVTIALCHLLFNISGILLFFPIPQMRSLPINAAKYLGKTTARYRWFAAVYLLFMFFLFPFLVFCFSMAGVVVLSVVGATVIFTVVGVIMLNFMQNNHKEILPGFLTTWDFLPVWMRSLEPWDRLIFSLCCCCKCCWQTTSSTAPGTPTLPEFDSRASFRTNFRSRYDVEVAKFSDNQTPPSPVSPLGSSRRYSDVEKTRMTVRSNPLSLV